MTINTAGLESACRKIHPANFNSATVKKLHLISSSFKGVSNSPKPRGRGRNLGACGLGAVTALGVAGPFSACAVACQAHAPQIIIYNTVLHKHYPKLQQRTQGKGHKRPNKGSCGGISKLCDIGRDFDGKDTRHHQS